MLSSRIKIKYEKYILSPNIKIFYLRDYSFLLPCSSNKRKVLCFLMLLWSAWFDLVVMSFIKMPHQMISFYLQGTLTLVNFIFYYNDMRQQFYTSNQWSCLCAYDHCASSSMISIIFKCFLYQMDISQTKLLHFISWHLHSISDIFFYFRHFFFSFPTYWFFFSISEFTCPAT